MPELTTQKAVRPAASLPFCYLCGKPLRKRADIHPDHVPPKAIFDVSDRNFPLKVASCLDCNNKHSPTDETIGQLIAVCHGKMPKEHKLAIEFRTYNVEGLDEPFMACVHTNIGGQITRWMRAFHTALYHEFLPNKTMNAVHSPFPNGKLTEDGFTIDKVLQQQFMFVEIIKKNRIAKNLDRIVCNNGKLQYDCVWMRMDDGKWCCVFALQVYDWVNLADTNFTRRGCVGFYRPTAGKPVNATIATDLEFVVPNDDLLNAFAP